jgi:hypothetical protein
MLALLLAWASAGAAAPTRECLLELRLGVAPPPESGVVRCQDGDPACDTDGTVDGGCSFAVGLCLDAEGCTPGTVERVRVRRGPVALRSASEALVYPVAGPLCTQSVPVRVALGRRRARRAMIAVSARGGGARDRDRLALVCTAVPGSRPGRARAVVLATDFETGELSTVRVARPHGVTAIAEPVHSDGVVRVEGGRVFVLNRFFADNVQVLDPARGLATVLQCSTGPGSNPHDIVVVDAHKAYVTRYGERTLWIVDPGAPPNCARFRTGAIDLSAFADADGIPEMDEMALAGGRLFVTVQRLDRLREFAPTDQSRIAVIDPATDTVIGSIVLSGRNAFGDSSRLAHEPGTGKLLVAEAGNIYRTGDGGIERVDPLAPFERAAEGFVITEDALGGSITDFVMVSATKGYAVVSTESIKNVLVAFDPSRGVVTRRLLVRDGFLPDVALAPDGMLWLADQGLPAPGIRIFDPADDRQLTRAPIDVGLPPFSMGFLP